jgi:tetratricopeptide (TPR) repeat protein
MISGLLKEDLINLHKTNIDMKTFVHRCLLLALVVVGMILSANAQRVIKGVVYREGKPAAGVTVEIQRSSQKVMTSFDGVYEVQGDDKSKWLRFTFIDESKRVDLPDGVSTFDFLFDDVEPASGVEVAGGISLKSAQELVAANDLDFMNSLSMYNEFYKQKDFKSTLGPWRNLYDNYPKSTLNIYIHGVVMYEEFIEKASTREAKDAFLDSLMNIYDRRIKYFNQKGYVLGRKATTWLRYHLPPAEDLTEDELVEIYRKGYDMLGESIREQGVETEIPVVVLLMQASRSLFSLGKLPKEDVVKNYELTIGVLDKKQNEKPDEEGIAEARSAIEMIFGTSGAADCEALISIYTGQYEEKKSDIDYLKTMLRRLTRANCDDSNLFFKASEQMYKLEPSAEAAFNMARMFVRTGDTDRAKGYYKQAMEQESDQGLLENYYYEYALFIFAKENNLQESRNYARRALAINPNNCKANMLIGDLYVAGSRSFDDDFERSSVFWIAVDYFNKARSGEECIADATHKANTYRNYFPNKETAFFMSIKEGDNYTVKGWINETTKVRF